MKHQSALAVLVSAFFVIAGCSKQENNNASNNNFYSTLWLQSAAEYKANALQTYNTAKHNIDRALNDSSWTALPEQSAGYQNLPPAIILDVDETVLDNSPYQAQLLKDGNEFDLASWDQWVSMKSAAAVPGAVDFINHVSAKGVEVIFLTNRECTPRLNSDEDCPQKLDTIDNLKNVGIKNVKPENVLLKMAKPEWTSEKSTRREYAAQSYRVIMLFGDDLGDFLPDVKKNITAGERAALVKKYTSKWGSKWFMLSNPTYGSWLRVLDEPKAKHLEGYQEK